jgi:hypothetical protein
MAGEAHQPVVGGVLVRLAPRGDGEGGVDEPVDRATPLLRCVRETWALNICAARPVSS